MWVVHVQRKKCKQFGKEPEHILEEKLLSFLNFQKEALAEVCALWVPSGVNNKTHHPLYMQF